LKCEVLFRPRASRDLRKLKPEAQERIVRAIRLLADSAQGDVAKLTGVHPPEWRLRVGVRFRRIGDRLEILHAFDREEACR
jgi:mRNA-degrading endonuclease RelE of RelBE toxin-antitoxin system